MKIEITKDQVSDLRWSNYLLRTRLDAAIKMLVEQGVEPEEPDPNPDDWRFWETVLQTLPDHMAIPDIPDVAIDNLQYSMDTHSMRIMFRGFHRARLHHQYDVEGIVMPTGVKMLRFVIEPHADGHFLDEAPS